MACSPPGSSVHGENTGAGCHFLLQGIFLTQGSSPHLLPWQADSLPLSHQGNRKRSGFCPLNSRFPVPKSSGWVLIAHHQLVALWHVNHALSRSPIPHPPQAPWDPPIAHQSHKSPNTQSCHRSAPLLVPFLLHHEGERSMSGHPWDSGRDNFISKTSWATQAQSLTSFFAPRASPSKLFLL